MKRREVGRDFTSRTERYLERPGDGSVMALFCEHWSRETDPAAIAREAAAWLRSCPLPDGPPADRSLCEHLRSDHGARHDWPEDLAARIIDLVAVLEAIESRGEDDWFNAEVPVEVGVHPSLERLRTKYWFTAGVAVELGTLHALFSIYRQQDETRKKPRQPRHLAWGDAAAVKFIKLPGTSDRERWAQITEDFEVFVDGRRWCCYREEDKKKIERLWAYADDDPRMAHQRGPAYRAFIDEYVTPARKRRPSRRRRK